MTSLFLAALIVIGDAGGEDPLVETWIKREKWDERYLQHCEKWEEEHVATLRQNVAYDSAVIKKAKTGGINKQKPQTNFAEIVDADKLPKVVYFPNTAARTATIKDYVKRSQESKHALEDYLATRKMPFLVFPRSPQQIKVGDIGVMPVTFRVRAAMGKVLLANKLSADGNIEHNAFLFSTSNLDNPLLLEDTFCFVLAEKAVAWEKNSACDKPCVVTGILENKPWVVIMRIPPAAIKDMSDRYKVATKDKTFPDRETEGAEH